MKKRKYRLKKGAIVFFAVLGILILLGIIVLLFNVFKTKSYTLNYDIKEYSISENYDKNKELYYYEIEYKGVKYNFIYEHKYLKERQLINNIKNYEDEDYVCLIVLSDYIESYPLCSKNKEIIDYHLVSDTILEELKPKAFNKNIDSAYKNYQITNINEPMLIWNYRGFDVISKDKLSTIKLFNKDIYNVKLATVINNYLFIPDYEQSHNFNKAYVIDLKTMTKKEWELDYEISFSSYILGTHDDSIFLVDQKNKKEYELVPYKRKMRIVGTNNKKGITYINGKETKISMTKLINKEQSFNADDANYKYVIKDNKLYLKYVDSNIKTRVTDKDVDKIVFINNDTVYYLVKDTLYFYNLEYGEKELVTYSEWEFNNENTILVY